MPHLGKTSRRIFAPWPGAVVKMCALPALLAAALPLGGRAAEPKKPNILIILVDDMGYGDVGVYGCKDIPTPHIDSVANQGIRFTQGYVTSPQCGPSRAALLTGITQNRLGIEVNQDIDPAGFKPGIKLFGDYLRDAGYRTGLVGKWHMGRQKGSLPLERGFDWFYGFLGGGSHFVAAEGEESIPDILENATPQKVNRYLTDVLTDHAIRFIENDVTHAPGATPGDSAPFFLFLSYNAPHAPLQAPQEYVQKFEHLAVEGEQGVRCAYTKTHIAHPRQVYAAMVANLDDNIGRLLETLRSNGLEEDTLVVFLSDNGGPTKVTAADNSPWRGVKGNVLEGGVRVPFALQWKGVIPAGRVSATPVSSLDLLPTALAAAGWEIPAGLDGVSLLPLLREDKPLAPRTFFWRFPHPPHYPVWGILRGDHKLVAEALTGRDRQAGLDGKVGLYNLATDLTEERDLSGQSPDVRRQLQQEWDSWNAALPTPRSRSAGPGKNGRLSEPQALPAGGRPSSSAPRQ
jgi:arylsulfatase A-like enzyme